MGNFFILLEDTAFAVVPSAAAATVVQKFIPESLYLSKVRDVMCLL